MSVQEAIAYGIGLLACAYMVWRWRSKRGAGTCCGAKECPASKRIVERLEG